MPQNYILVIDGKPKGPFSIEQLKEFKIKPGDFVKTPGMDDYKEAHEIAELRTLFGFSDKSFTPQYFSGFDQRLIASVLDWFFVSGACILIAVIVSLFASKELRLPVIIALLIAIPLINFIYHIVMESSVKQGTYGKQLIRIKVCDMDGKRLSIAHATARNLAKLFSTLPFFTGYLFSFFNKQQQCLHDAIAGTLVIKDRLF
jgi:uncharacterized RDD family membrane protein YckC